MWEHDWAGRRTAVASPSAINAFGAPRMRSMAPLFWEEHCVECAIPGCYTSCPLFVARPDGGCARFATGIIANGAYPGPLGYGAEIQFRRWAKLETRVPKGFVRPRTVAAMAATDRLLGRFVRWLADRVPTASRDRLRGAYTWRRRERLAGLGRVDGWDDAQLVAEVWNLGSAPVRLSVEHALGALTTFRTSWTVEPGHNRFSLPMASVTGLAPGGDGSLLRLAPEGDDGAHLVFGTLDIGIVDHEESPSSTHAPFVKCVAWDLDNTVWRGVLVEDGADQLVVDERVVTLMKAFDERGILQTAVSKNDLEPAIEVLRRHGLDEYLLHPAISWGPKSEGLRNIATQLNLGLDSFLLVDDSAFERAEVAHALPQVRVVDVAELDELAGRPELRPPFSSEAAGRRLRYREEEQRQAILHEMGSEYDEFIRSCEMVITVVSPAEDADIARSVELIQRSNQLNLSGRRLDENTFRALGETPGAAWLALRATDRFGDYGLVGVLRTQENGDVLELTDLCISCRAARRMMEQAWFGWLADRSASRFRALVANFVVTDRNGPLRAALLESGFEVTDPTPEHERLVLTLPATVLGAELIAVVDQTTVTR